MASPASGQYPAFYAPYDPLSANAFCDFVSASKLRETTVDCGAQRWLAVEDFTQVDFRLFGSLLPTDVSRDFPTRCVIRKLPSVGNPLHLPLMGVTLDCLFSK